MIKISPMFVFQALTFDENEEHLAEHLFPFLNLN